MGARLQDPVTKTLAKELAEAKDDVGDDLTPADKKRRMAVDLDTKGDDTEEVASPTGEEESRKKGKRKAKKDTNLPGDRERSDVAEPETEPGAESVSASPSPSPTPKAGEERPSPKTRRKDRRASKEKRPASQGDDEADQDVEADGDKSPSSAKGRKQRSRKGKLEAVGEEAKNAGADG